jgi:hypothetical protein
MTTASSYPAAWQRKPPAEPVYLTPGERKRRLEAAYLERFFAREQRRLATGILPADERQRIRLPSKGRVKRTTAQLLGLVPNPSARPADPETTHWIPSAPLGDLHFSPFLPRPNITSTRWPDMVKPLISALQHRRLWHAAHRQGLAHLLPPGPPGKVEQYALAERKRAESADSHSELLRLAAQHWGTSATTSRDRATPRQVDGVMRRFAITLPKYAHVPRARNLFPYHRLRMRKRLARAKQIVKAMEEMPAKIAAYRKVRSKTLRRVWLIRRTDRGRGQAGFEAYVAAMIAAHYTLCTDVLLGRIAIIAVKAKSASNRASA